MIHIYIYIYIYIHIVREAVASFARAGAHELRAACGGRRLPESGTVAGAGISHGSVVTLVRCGLRVATASADGTARVWDADGGRCLQTLAGHEGEVTSAAFSPCGLLLATGSADASARTWRAETGEPVAVFRIFI